MDRPATPPPPYTPLQPAPSPADPPADEPPCPHSVISVPSDAPLPSSPEATQALLHGAANPNKDLTPGRYRRFTGDSGIEVCDGQELWDQQGSLEREGEAGEQEADGAEEPQDPGTFEHTNAAVHENTDGQTESQSLR